MYRPGHEEDVPAPFDAPGPPAGDEEPALLPNERGSASAKSSKRSVALVGGGACSFHGLVGFNAARTAGKTQQKTQPKKPKSQGPVAPWVVQQVQFGAKGAFRTFAQLEEARKCVSSFDEEDAECRFLWCKCGAKLGTRVNVWQRHFTTSAHKEGVAKEKKQVHLGGVLVDTVAEEARRRRLADELVAHRIRVARAVYSTSLSVNVVQHDGDLKELLQEGRPRRMSIGSSLANDTRDHLVQDVLQRYTAEFRGRPLLLTFDSTPRRDDVCAVLLSFVDDNFNVVDRLVSLRLFGASLNGAEYVDVVLSAMERQTANFVLQLRPWWRQQAVHTRTAACLHEDDANLVHPAYAQPCRPQSQVSGAR